MGFWDKLLIAGVVAVFVLIAAVIAGTLYVLFT